MNKPKIFRKRFVPDEIVDISSDEILFRDSEILITKWKTIRPKTEFAWGVSYAFLKDGYKISKFYNKDNNFVYWYCDIIEVDYDGAKDTYILTDMLVDLKIMPDGRVMVLDLDEMSDAVQNKIITLEQTAKALASLGRLFDIINQDKFPPQVCVDRN